MKPASQWQRELCDNLSLEIPLIEIRNIQADAMRHAAGIASGKASTFTATFQIEAEASRLEKEQD